MDSTHDTRSEPNQQTKSTNKMRLFLIFIVIFCLLSTVIIGIKYRTMKRKNELEFEVVQSSELHLLNLEKELLQRKIQRLVSDTFVIKGFIESSLQVKDQIDFEEQVKNYFKNFIENKLVYYQIRYLDEKGLEIVRADYKNGVCTLCPKDKLQNKADRYYFTETQKIKEDQAYISKLDLNIENGQLELPLTPMIRVSTNVYDGAGNNKGIVIVNYFAEIIINDFENVGKSSYGSLYLLNHDSYWIKNLKDSTKDFAFMYEDRLNQNFSHDYPDVWSQIMDQNSSFIQTEQDMFFIEELSLFQDYGQSKYVTSADRIIANDKNFFIISHIGNKDYPSFFKKNIIAYIPDILAEEKIVLVLIGFLSLFLAIYIHFYLLKQTNLKFFSERDQLTAVLNRRAGMNKIQEIVKKTRENNHPVCVMFIDVNGLKSVNDTLGHHYGDELIQSVAQIISSAIRTNDILFRYGGDEFVLCFENMNEDKANKFWTRVLKKVDETNSNPNLKYNISISHGISFIRPEEKKVDIEHYINQADENMYAEKIEMKKTAIIIRK